MKVHRKLGMALAALTIIVSTAAGISAEEIRAPRNFPAASFQENDSDLYVIDYLGEMTEEKKRAATEEIEQMEKLFSNLGPRPEGPYAIDVKVPSMSSSQEYDESQIHITDYLGEMTEEQKLQATAEIEQWSKNFRPSNTYTEDLRMKTASRPKKYYNLSVNDYLGSGSFTQNDLYTNHYFSPNSKSELHIAGTATATKFDPPCVGMYIELIRKSDGESVIKSPITAYAIAENGKSFMKFDYAIGTLDPNEFYYFRFSPEDFCPSTYQIRFVIH